MKLIWSREEAFLRDALRPMGLARLRTCLDENGMPRARKFGAYAVKPPSRMPRVHVRIVESGAPMGAPVSQGYRAHHQRWSTPWQRSPASAYAACSCPGPTSLALDMLDWDRSPHHQTQGKAKQVSKLGDQFVMAIQRLEIRLHCRQRRRRLQPLLT